MIKKKLFSLLFFFIIIYIYNSLFLSLSFTYFKAKQKKMLNVHPMHFASPPEFRIQLENDHLILHGSSEESAGTILRGKVFFNSYEKTKVKSIKLRFTGVTSVSWSEGNFIL